MFRAIPNGANRLYHANSTKAETLSTGFMVNGHLDLVDNDKIRLGASQDLQIYHDGTTNQIISGTGADIRIGTSGEAYALFKNNGAVELYYDNSKKLETNSTGAELNGQLRFTENNFLGDACQIQRHSNYLWYQSPANGHIWRSSAGNNLWRMSDDGHFFPFSNNSFDIGTSSNRVRNIYTNDLHLSNVGHSNDVDGTWGDWTIQEGESDLFLKNNRSGKKYKFNLTEVS
jgi:hypothetical protein